MKFNWFIGIDVSKKTLDFHVRHLSNDIVHQQVDNTLKGIKSILVTCKKLKVDFKDAVFCLEYTGVYNELLVSTFHEKELNIWVVQGLHVKRSLGMQRGKNDKVDASRISEFAFRFQDKCKLWQPPSSSLRQLKGLTALRNRLIKARKLLKVPIAELAQCGTDKKHTSYLSKLNQPVITQISEQLIKVESEINQVISQDQRLLELEQIITSVDGVGPVTAWEMILATNQFQSIQDGRKFACYAGVAPFDYQSGSSVKGRPRVSQMANKKMKQLLHLSALSATVMKGELNDYYNRKVAEGKNKMLVLNNIRNKMVLRIFACIRENRKYDKTYIQNVA
jgi:transposase